MYYNYDITSTCRDLDQACMEAVAALLQGLPLQPEESDRGDLMEAKTQLFLKYFTLFMNLLNDCTEAHEVSLMQFNWDYSNTFDYIDVIFRVNNDLFSTEPTNIINSEPHDL